LVFNKRKYRIEAKNNDQTFIFNSIVEAAFKLFSDKNQSKNIYKHMQRGTKFRDYYFSRVL